MVADRFRASCEFCKHELNTQEAGVHQFVSGWVKNRSGGGGHGISLPKRENRWAHGYCIDRLSGGSFGTADMFKADAQPAARPPPEPTPTNASYDARGRLLKICNVCGRDACFGVGVGLRNDNLGLWYCLTHRPEAVTQ